MENLSQIIKKVWNYNTLYSLLPEQKLFADIDKEKN